MDDVTQKLFEGSLGDIEAASNRDTLVDSDTPDRVSKELVEAELVDGRDRIVLAANLQKMLDNPDLKSLTFALNSGCGANEVPDDKTLLGYAQLTIAEQEPEEA